MYYGDDVITLTISNPLVYERELLIKYASLLQMPPLNISLPKYGE